jgi:hypothetical protein
MCWNGESLLSIPPLLLLASTIQSRHKKRQCKECMRDKTSTLYLYERRKQNSAPQLAMCQTLFSFSKRRIPLLITVENLDTDLINVQQNWQKENNLQITNREIYESERSRVKCMLKQHQTRCMSVQKSIPERMMCAKKTSRIWVHERQ